MKAIVTGANGFVGSHLVERLLKEQLEVVCLVRPTSDLRWIRSLPVEVRADALDSVAAAAAAMAGADYVFHVAGVTRARSAAEYMAVNAEGTRRIVEAAVRSGAALRRFVHVSSLAAVGPNRKRGHPSFSAFHADPASRVNDPTQARPAPAESAEKEGCPLFPEQDESTEPHPADDYGRSKLAAERIVLAAADKLPVSIVRPPGVYGPRDTNFLPMFRTARRLGVFLAIGGGPKQVSLVHAEDLAEGIWLAAAARDGGQPPSAVSSYPPPSGRGSKGEGEIYFIASGTHTMADFAAAMSVAVGRPLRTVNVPRWLAILAGEFGQLKWALTGRSQIVARRKIRDLLQPAWTCDWSKARRELGYQERVALTDGMRQTALWYAEQGWIRPIAP